LLSGFWQFNLEALHADHHIPVATFGGTPRNKGKKEKSDSPIKKIGNQFS
jgi:hypothetical protein